MNRYPLWKYLTVAVALIIGLLYTLPNFFRESPAVQIAPAKSTVRVYFIVHHRVEVQLHENGIESTGAFFEQSGPTGTVRVRFETTDVQLRAKDLIERTLNPTPDDPSYTVALNLLSASPSWLTAIGANPMYLGLDLRGGVHFLLQVDMRGALTGRYDTLGNDVRAILRDARVPLAGVERSDLSVVASFNNEAERDTAISELRRALPDMTFMSTGQSGGHYTLRGELTEQAVTAVQTNALRQN